MMSARTTQQIKVYQELPEEVPGAVYQIEKVLNWEKRIEGYSEYKKSLYKKAFEKQQEFIDVMADKGSHWKVTIDNKKNNLFCEEMKSKRGYPTIRVKSTYDYSALTMWRAFIDPETRCGYDKNVAETKAIKNIGCNLSISY